MHSQSHTHTHTYTHCDTHTHTHTQTHTVTHTHTQTHCDTEHHRPAPHSPAGRRPVCIQSLFILCTSLRAVVTTSFPLLPNWRRAAKRSMYKHGSGGKNTWIYSTTYLVKVSYAHDFLLKAFAHAEKSHGLSFHSRDQNKLWNHNIRTPYF